MQATEIPLAEVIQQLRSQLRDAIEAGEGDDLRFGIEGLELELQVVVTQGASATLGAEGDVKFWVLNALGKGELSGNFENSHVQTLRLKLRPKGPDGSPPDLAG